MLKKVVMCKDLCREDREAAKVKYMEKKQNREAARGDGGSAAAATGSQVPPQEPNRGRQGAERDNTTPPQLRGQQGAP